MRRRMVALFSCFFLFAVAASAEATIAVKSVIVKSDKVAAPVAVRYVWDNYPFGANLYNAAGLPAAPFRTDSWDALAEISKEFAGK